MQLVRRALQIVVQLTEYGDGLTAQQLCELTGIPCSSMHRLLAVLEDEGFVSRHRDHRRYFAGPSASEVGSASLGRSLIAERAELPLTELACATGAAALLTELVDAAAVCTLRRGGDTRVPVETEAGRRLPFHSTAEARGLLADMSRPTLSRLLSATDLMPFRPRTPRTIEEVAQRVALIREHGCGVSYDEFDPGIWSLAAPVRNGARHVVATVAVAMAGVRVGSRETVHFIRAQVIAAAGEVSAQLGGQRVRAA